MNNISLAFNAVMPLLILMTIGIGARKCGIMDDQLIKGLNRLIFNLLLPVLMFINVYNTDMRKVFDVRLVLFVLCVTFCVFIAAFLTVPIFEKDRSRCGSMVQGLVRGNGAYFGIPMTVSLIGEKYAGLMALVVAFAAIFYNFSSVVAFESFRKGKTDYKKIIWGVVSNPMIIGTLLGIFFVILNIALPELIFNSMTDISRTTTPLALITLGASFKFSSVEKYKKELIAAVMLKLVIIPALAVGGAVLMGFKNYEICCVFSLLSAPTAVATFAVAQQMGGDDELAGHIVVFTSILSIITIFMWIIFIGNYILV